MLWGSCTCWESDVGAVRIYWVLKSVVGPELSVAAAEGVL